MNKIEGGNLSRRGRGRPAGSQNKIGKAAKEVIAEAADRLGGVDRLVAWSQEDSKNEGAFWSTIYPKLLPLQVSADVNILTPQAQAWLGLKPTS